VGDYIYNWPVSQWAAVARVNFGSEGYAKAGIFDSNTDYLSTKPNPALWPTFPDDSQGVIRPAEVAWTPKFNGLAGTYRIGGWWNSSAAPNVATSIDGEPILVSGPPGVPGHGRYGFFTVLQQQLARDPANPDPKNGLNAFLLATCADRRTSTKDDQIFGGIGAIWPRPLETQGRIWDRRRHDARQSECRQRTDLGQRLGHRSRLRAAQ